MLLFATDEFPLDLPATHPFPAARYPRLRDRVVAMGLGARLRRPHAATDRELAHAHAPRWIDRVRRGELGPDEVRRLGFPWSEALVERSRRSCGATIDAARAALEDGVGVSLAGGTHHAFRDHGRAFCVFNDAAVTATLLLAEGAAERALIVDCDVHQGDGTASILAGAPDVFTFSIHGARNYPRVKVPSDLDVALPDGTGDREYLDALDAALEEAFRRARPDLVLYLAGADPLAGDRFGRLALTRAGLRERDRRVLAACRAADSAVAVMMAGGYARNVEDTVDVNAATVEEALRAAGALA